MCSCQSVAQRFIPAKCNPMRSQISRKEPHNEQHRPHHHGNTRKNYLPDPRRKGNARSRSRKLYDVSTAALNQAVRRNSERFPEDFMFQLTSEEVSQLNRSQIVIGSQKHRDPRSRPYAFTEQGVAMLSRLSYEVSERKPSTSKS